MPETGRNPQKSAAPRIDAMCPASAHRMEIPAREPGPSPRPSRTGAGGGPASQNFATLEPLEVAPVAWFTLGGHQCEVMPLDAVPDGREVLGTLALDGRTYLVLSAATELDAPDLTDVLTPRELEIALLVAGGWDAKAIGRRLTISFHTVRVHTGRIYGKLNIHKQSELIACVAKQWSLPRVTHANGRLCPTRVRA